MAAPRRKHGEVSAPGQVSHGAPRTGRVFLDGRWLPRRGAATITADHANRLGRAPGIGTGRCPSPVQIAAAVAASPCCRDALELAIKPGGSATDSGGRASDRVIGCIQIDFVCSWVVSARPRTSLRPSILRELRSLRRNGHATPVRVSSPRRRVGIAKSRPNIPSA